MTGLDNLLVVQDHDTTADQLRHRKATLPERAELGRVEQSLIEVAAAFERTEAERNEVARRQQRLEDDVDSLEAKIADLDKRLYSGAVTSPRELQAMQADEESLRRRRSALEDEVLEAMEAREPLDAELARLEEDRRRLDDAGIGLRAQLAEAEASIEEELIGVAEARRQAASGVAADVLSTYETLRAKLGGVGAARLVGGSCSGCHLRLPATELARIKRGPSEVLLQCDQCGRLLVP